MSITESPPGLGKSAKTCFGIIGMLVGFGSWFLVAAGLLLLLASLALGGPYGDWSTFPLILATLAVLGTLGFAVRMKSKQGTLLTALALRRLLGVFLLFAAAVVLVPYPNAQSNQPYHLLVAGILGAGGLAVFLTWRKPRASNS